MSVHLTIDKAGRVVIPKGTHKALHLEPGDTLEMDRAGEQITLRPLRATGPLSKEQGVWVFRTGKLLPSSATDNVLQHLRDERDLANQGIGE